MIREACHEVQRPVFYAIAIIITAYLPIFTLQRVEGRLFRPMAWTVAFALLGAMTFSILIAPVLAGTFFRKGVQERRNLVMDYLTERYRRRLRWAVQHRWVVAGVGIAALAGTIYLGFGGVIGAEFLPHLDEGAIWARGTLANSTSLSEGEKFTTNERYVFASFPEVKTVVSEVGRPDDGTDTGGFGNTEYFVDLKPHDQWRPVFHKNKEELIAAMNRAVQKYPGRDLELLAAHRRQRRRDDDGHQGFAGAQDFRGRPEDFSSRRAKKSPPSWRPSRACMTSSSCAISASRIST